MLCKTLLFVILVHLLRDAISYTRVSVYEGYDFNKRESTHPDVDPFSYIYIQPERDNLGSSMKIHSGSCIEMHMNNPPTYTTSNDWFWTTSLELGRNFFQVTHPHYNDRISAYKRCGNYTKTIQCPSGTFVKKILWDNSNMMRNGIELQCFLPRSLTPTSRLRTHGSGTLYGSAECTGVRGINYTWDRRRLADVNISPVCRPTTSPNAGGILACGPGKAISGMVIDIENRSGFIKNSNIYCRDVGDIEAICAAHDKTSSLFICDASHALYPLKCTHAKTVGYGYATSQTEEQRRERTFYEEFGFEMGYAGAGLSYNFHYNVGHSETTGYSWATTQENTFQREITVTVEAEAPAGCITTVVEIIGECSFMQARPNFFQRYDKCNNITFVTDVFIPIDAIAAKIFVSKIPETVLDHLSPNVYVNAGGEIAADVSGN